MITQNTVERLRLRLRLFLKNFFVRLRLGIRNRKIIVKRIRLRLITHLWVLKFSMLRVKARQIQFWH